MHTVLRQARLVVGLQGHIPSQQLGWLTRAQSTSTPPAAAPPERGGDQSSTPTPSGADAPLGRSLTSLESPRHSGSFWAVEPPLPIVPPPSNHHHIRNSRFIPLCFDNTQSAYRNITTFSLVRAIGVLSVCRIEPLVKHADALYTWSRRILGPIPSFFMRYTFFAHFCAGEDQDSIQPTVKELHRCGIGAILDYAAESDVHSNAGVAGADSLSETNYSVIARTYGYDNEKKCDSHVRIFMRALEAARTLPGQGFAAIKVTALGNPNLLHMLSNTIEEVKRLFARFDLDGNGFLTKGEFCQVYDDLFIDENGAEEMFEKLDILHNDKVDYVTFVDSLKIADIPQLTSKCRNVGPLKLATPNLEELQLMEAMVDRVRELCRYASNHDLRIMIDAEHCYLQPAIDSIAKDMMKEFNGTVPVVYNTYQCYLKDSRFRLNADIESARRQGYMFSAKLVRGAYMVHENKLAKAKGIESPVHETEWGTHANYNRCVRIMIQEVACGRAEVMIATHNQYSVETAVRSMHDFGMHQDTNGVFFGQLLGMADHLSHVLGRHKYRAYKYVPFGPLEETMPYLIRRAQENGTLMGGVVREMNMLQSEVWRRVVG